MTLEWGNVINVVKEALTSFSIELEGTCGITKGKFNEVMKQCNGKCWCGVKAWWNYECLYFGVRCEKHIEKGMVNIFSTEMGRKRFIKSVEGMGGKVLGEYKGNKIPVECICKNGHKCWLRPGGIQQGKTCWTCGTNFETSKHNFIKNIEKLGGKVIGKYINARIPVDCICKNGHKCCPSPDSIKQGRGCCSRCRNKTEGKIMNFLQSLYLSITSQATFPWCRNPKTSSLYLYDFYLPDLKILIEVDGRQHFQQVSNWVAPEI